MRCRTAVFTVEGSPRRLPAERAVGPRAQCAHPRRGGCRARLDRAELARAAARNSPAAARPRRDACDMDAAGDAQSRSRTGAHIATADRRSAARHVAEGVHRPAGTGRQTAPDLRQDAVDHNAEAASAAVLGTRRRRRRRPQPESAATEPAAGQRPRHHARAPSRYSVSGVELVDQELHARPRRCSRTRTHQPSAPSGGGHPPICGSGSRSTPIAR